MEDKLVDVYDNRLKLLKTIEKKNGQFIFFDGLIFLSSSS